jgi:hypothetical protein
LCKGLTLLNTALQQNGSCLNGGMFAEMGSMHYLKLHLEQLQIFIDGIEYNLWCKPIDILGEYWSKVCLHHLAVHGQSVSIENADRILERINLPCHPDYLREVHQHYPPPQSSFWYLD